MALSVFLLVEKRRAALEQFLQEVVNLDAVANSVHLVFLALV